MPIVREEPDLAKFNTALDLPYELRLKDFELAMQDVYDFFFDVNTNLQVKGLRRFDDMLRPAAMSGLLSDMLTSSMAMHSRTLVENQYFNGHPDLIVNGVYPKNTVKAGEHGVEIKSTRKRGGAVDTHGARAQWMCVFVYEVDNLTEPAADRAAMRFTDPKEPATGSKWGPATTENGWFEAPDNAAVDGMGRLWVATDGNKAGSHSNRSDGVWAVETEGALRGTGRHFFRTPVGAELCGPRFTPDDRTLFVSIQHPADAGVKDWAPFGRASTFEDPATHWPDFKAGMPPRPSVVVITKQGGGMIGT